MEKDDLNMLCFGCIVEYFVLVFMHVCFTAFGNLDFLDLHYGAFIFNVYEKKNHLRNSSKIKDRNFSARTFFRI